MNESHYSPIKCNKAQLEEKPGFLNPRGDRVPLVLSEGCDNANQVEVPAPVNQHLRDYQRTGVQFLYDHFANDCGAILGDDMGLGKTVQVIAFLSAVLGKSGTQEDLLKQRPKFIRQMSGTVDDEPAEKRPFLIIGPASVLYNWVDELEVWGYFTVGKFHKGHKSDTLSLLERGRVEVVVTTFETCRDWVDDLNRFEWSAIIADEVHKIKGLKAEVTVALKKLKCKRRFGLTGTLLQNNLTELWCVLDWVAPGKLGDHKTFVEKYAKPIEYGQKHDATKRELADARLARTALADIKRKLFLRRTKKHIADQLPKKEEMVIYCKPTDIQVNVYRAILAHEDMKLVLTQHDPCICDSGLNRGHCCFGKNKDGIKVKTLTLTFMHLLMKTANHVALLLPEQTSSDMQKRYAQEVCKVALQCHPEFVEQARIASFRTLSNPKHCGKMKVLHGLLKVFRKELCKVLLFSYSVRLLDIIEQHVISMGYEFRRLDGKTQDFKRVQIVREFNKDPNIFLFLASTKAGGVGLNLTGANVVIIFDPNWNPTHDLQAQDRAYRLGQGRDVRIYRLILTGTIEENIYLRQIYKQQLDNVAISEENARRYFHGVAGDKHNKGELFGVENMFRFRTGGGSLTADILNRNKLIESGLTSSGYIVAKYIPGKEGGDEDTQDLTGEPVEDQYGLEQVYNSMVKVYGNDSVDSDELKIEQFESDDESFGSKLTRAEQLKAAQSSKDEPVPSTSGISKYRPSVSPGLKRKSDSPVGFSGSKLLKCVNVTGRRNSEEKSIPIKRNKEEHVTAIKSTVTDDTTVLKKGQDTTDCIKGGGFEWLSSDSEDSEQEHSNGVRVANDSRMQSSSFSSVGDVLKQCGVVHTHDNRKVVGASRAEDYMSRCAIKDVYELHQLTQQPAMNCQPYSESTDSEESEDNRKSKNTKHAEGKTAKRRQNTNDADTVDLSLPAPQSVKYENHKLLIGQTPKLIQRKQLRQILAMTKYSSLTDLAEAVLRCSPEEQLEILHKFYKNKYPEIEKVLR